MAGYSIFHVLIEHHASTDDMLMISFDVDSVKTFLTNFNTEWLLIAVFIVLSVLCSVQCDMHPSMGHIQ